MIMEINLDISTIMEIYDTMQFGKGVVSPLNYKPCCSVSSKISDYYVTV